MKKRISVEIGQVSGRLNSQKRPIIKIEKLEDRNE